MALHELGHQFLGHVDNLGRIRNYPYDISVNMRLFLQSTGVGSSQLGFREGLAPRMYAVPANPEAYKPRKE